MSNPKMVSLRRTADRPQASESETTFSQIGRSVSRSESVLKVNGTAEYIYHMRIPGMLYGKIFRSSVAHGRIVRIDTSEALAVEGVEAVLTGEDIRKAIPEPYYGPAFHD